ncbi:hypothetical protein VTK73DRAFT_4897 [Phialemonium thermophilum]|uniref:Uncharacterized protein n=1 Tax=Phialemonium thermophilum TaxID=223376 RepID=A0ABR3V578_9PEZI
MAQHYSNGLLAAQPSSHGRHYHAAASSSSSSSSPFRDRHDSSLLDDLFALVAHAARSLRTFWHERGRDLTVAFLAYVARQLRRNLTVARLLSLPHLLVAFWVVVLLWGERWVFQSAVSKCHWSNWESWVSNGPPSLPARTTVFHRKNIRLS